MGERNSQALAIGWRDEGKLRPAPGAQPAVLGDRLTAAGTQWRQADINGAAKGLPNRGGKAREGCLARIRRGGVRFHGGTLTRRQIGLNAAPLHFETAYLLTPSSPSEERE